MIHNERNIQADRRRHIGTHIQTDRRTDMHIESEKYSGGHKGDIQRHTFRRTEGHTYI